MTLVGVRIDTCRPRLLKILGAVLASIIILLSIILIYAASSIGGLAWTIAILALLTGAGGLYYIGSSIRRLLAGVNLLCGKCGEATFYPLIQAVGCRSGDTVLCYSGVLNALYSAEGSIEPARQEPGMHCAKLLDGTGGGEGVYRGIALVRGDTVYRVSGTLRVSRLGGCE